MRELGDMGYDFVAGLEVEFHVFRVEEQNMALAQSGQPGQPHYFPLDALEAAFMAHIEFISEHPGVPRMLFGELQRSGETLAKRMVQTLIRQYEQRLRRLMEAGKAQGELDADLDVDAAAVLFIGTIQGLVMQSLLAGKVSRIRRDAPAVFAIYRRGIESGT